MSKKIVIVHGDKGGTGKSMCSSILIDYYLNNNMGTLIVEGDGVVPDVARRYTGLAQSVRAPLSGDDPTEVVARLIDHIERSEDERIVLNLPASAGETLDPLAYDFIGPALKEIGIAINVIFVIGKTADSSILAGQSLSNGLVSIADKKIAVINGFFGIPDSFDWANSSARDNWLDCDGKEVFLPRLHDRVMNASLKGSFSQYVSPEGGLTVANRMLMNKWLKTAHLIGDMVEEIKNGS